MFLILSLSLFPVIPLTVGSLVLHVCASLPWAPTLVGYVPAPCLLRLPWIAQSIEQFSRSLSLLSLTLVLSQGDSDLWNM